MTDTEDPNQRKDRRKAVRIASIIVAESSAPIPCVVLDRSTGGFRLHVHEPGEVPDGFKLHLTADDSFYDCECVWRRGNEIGVKVV